MSDFSISLLFL